MTQTERWVLAAHQQALVIRTGPCFGPWDRMNFVWSLLNALARDGAVDVGPEVVSPTYVPDLAHAVFDLLIDGASGLWHVTNPGELSRRLFARRVAEGAGFAPGAVGVQPGDAALNRALVSERGILIPPLESAIARFFRDSQFDWREPALPAVAAE